MADDTPTAVYEKVHLLKTKDIEEEDWGTVSDFLTIDIVCEDEYEDEYIVTCKGIPFKATWNYKKWAHAAIKIDFEFDAKTALFHYNPNLSYISHSVHDSTIYFVKKKFRSRKFSRKHGIPKWMVGLSFAILVPSFGVSSMLLYKGKQWETSEINNFTCQWMIVEAREIGTCDPRDCSVRKKPLAIRIKNSRSVRRYDISTNTYYTAFEHDYELVPKQKKNPENMSKSDPDKVLLYQPRLNNNNVNSNDS